MSIPLATFLHSTFSLLPSAMPDWTYRTLFRTPLLALPFRTARAIAFAGLGTLAKIPGGTFVIDFFGHTVPPRDLALVVDGVEYCSPVGLGPQLDPQFQALPALARFGVGWVEIDAELSLVDNLTDTIELCRQDERLRWPIRPDDLADALFDPAPSPALPVPHWLRIGSSLRPLNMNAAQASDAFAAAYHWEDEGQRAAAVCLNNLVMALAGEWTVAEWKQHLEYVLEFCSSGEQRQPLYIVLPANSSLEQWGEFLGVALSTGVDGFVIANTFCFQVFPSRLQHTECCALIRQLRATFGDELTIVAAAGIHSPEDAVECWRAGATLVQVDVGMVFAGPGLAKRVNEARRFWQSSLAAGSAHHPGVPWRGSNTNAPSPALPSANAARAVEQAWFWLLLLGLSMAGGGIMAWAIAATRVVLPYDEAYLDMTREQIARINPRLLLFMAHDRITLAGTMLAIGIFYSFLAWHAVRLGSHWAWVTIVASALSGFASFFLFLFFGYFDPFHALVTAILFQLLLAGWQGKLDSPALPRYPNLRETRAWKMAQWAQLLFVAQGVALLVGGTVICFVGSTTVFVHEDLEFLRTTREALLNLHPRLIPVVAHDRASFGGMLIANGIATLLSALWGFRQGDSWQWWMYALASTAAYGSTLLVHYSVGYSSAVHLAPAFVGFGGVILGLVLSYPYLMGLDVEHYRRWRELLKR